MEWPTTDQDLGCKTIKIVNGEMRYKSDMYILKSNVSIYDKMLVAAAKLRDSYKAYKEKIEGIKEATFFR